MYLEFSILIGGLVLLQFVSPSDIFLPFFGLLIPIFKTGRDAMYHLWSQIS